VNSEIVAQLLTNAAISTKASVRDNDNKNVTRNSALVANRTRLTIEFAYF